MPSKTISLVHGQTSDRAKLIITRILDQVKRDYALYLRDFREQWNSNVCDFSFAALGTTVAGAIEVHADRVIITADFPLVALPFWRGIESTIRQRAETLL